MDELQELRVLIHNPRDAELPAKVAVGKVLQLCPRQLTLRTGDRIAVRIKLRVAEERVQFLQHLVGQRVLEFLGFLVHFRPVQPERLHQKQFNEPMPANDAQRLSFAGRGESDAAARLVVHEPGIREGLNHRRSRTGCDGKGGGQPARRQQILPAASLLLVEVLQVILNRRAKHCRQDK